MATLWPQCGRERGLADRPCHQRAAHRHQHRRRHSPARQGDVPQGRHHHRWRRRLPQHDRQRANSRPRQHQLGRTERQEPLPPEIFCQEKALRPKGRQELGASGQQADGFHDDQPRSDEGGATGRRCRCQRYDSRGTLHKWRIPRQLRLHPAGGPLQQQRRSGGRHERHAPRVGQLLRRGLQIPRQLLHPPRQREGPRL